MMVDLVFDEMVHKRLSILLLLLSPITYLFLTHKIVAPYGKHATTTISSRDVHTKTSSTASQYTNSKNYYWGPSLNPKLAWFLMESPNLIWCAYAYKHRNPKMMDSISFAMLYSNNGYGAWNMESHNENHDNEGERRHCANMVLFAMFFIHYVNRCILYPLRMKKGSSSVNLAVFSSAFLFCTINGL